MIEKYMAVSIEREVIKRLDDFLRSSKAKVTKKLVFSIMVDDFIKKYSSKPLVVSLQSDKKQSLQ